MKKFLMMVAAALMVAVSAQAQNDYEEPKHEIAVSYGTLSNATWRAFGDFLGTSMISLGKVRYDDGSIFGALSLEYFYHITPLIGVGAVGCYTKETKNMYIGDTQKGEAKNSFITVLPAVKFNWLRKKYFGMYSKVAAGVSFASKKEDYTDGTASRSENSVEFNWQLSALGIEAGSPYVRGFVELGIGEQGMLLAGVRCKF